MHADLGLEPLDILQDLSVEWIPSRLELPNVLNPQNPSTINQATVESGSTPLQKR
jgi:hypothetical protein